MGDFFIDLFGNVFYDLIMIAFMLVGLISGVLLRPKAKSHVSKFDVNSKRFIDFDIVEESARSIECESQKGSPAQRFFKYHPGFTGMTGKIMKRPLTRYLGMSGTAYTVKANSEPVKATLADSLTVIWGEEFCKQVPDAQWKQIQDAKMDVTVEIDTKSVGENLPTIAEEDVKLEQDRAAAKVWWEGIKAGEKRDWVIMIITLVAGMGIMALISKMFGWW